MGEVAATVTHRLAPTAGSLSAYPAAFIPIITFTYCLMKLKNCRRFPEARNLPQSLLSSRCGAAPLPHLHHSDQPVCNSGTLDALPYDVIYTCYSLSQDIRLLSIGVLIKIYNVTEKAQKLRVVVLPKLLPK